MSKVHPLRDNQALAVDPRETVWLSASAGTGKTQVLSARVLRLLLTEGVNPSQILCLTFTKAGAAEMAVRVNEVLANWVRKPDIELAQELQAIGADTGPATRARARTLFAAVLDCPGGGLRIDTIHAFSQWLLGAFPQEAGLTPGTRAMEDRDRALLAREVLAGLLLDAETHGDTATLGALSALSLRYGPDEVERYLLRCAAARDAWFGPGSWGTGALAPRVKAMLGLDADESSAGLARMCEDGAVSVDALRLCLSAYGQWTGKKGAAGAATIGTWLGAEPEVRLATLDELHKILFTQKDTVRDVPSLEKFETHFAEAAEAVLACSLAIRERQALLALADFLVPSLTLGRAFAFAWDEAKAREGLIDFDDQIRQAAALLNRSDLSEWIRYKLDRRFDHVLIDEAQDTNAAQWEIIEALTGDFFAGAGQRDDAMRTLFVVGDYKQAIFRFQGTSPDNFVRQRERVRREMAGAADNSASLREARRPRRLQALGLGQSFRTAHPILEFVDRTIAHIGHERFGLGEPPEPHVGDRTRPGLVALWRPVGLVHEENREEAAEAPEDGDETWLSRPDRQLAENIARQIRRWMDHGFPLIKGQHRRAGPGDVMILVRKRKELASLIVARLHAAGVPVAGVDRLRLGAPLAVKDLVAALRFAVQPLDDLSLASLLVSPLVGWSQEQLLEHGYRPAKTPLWGHLSASRHPEAVAAVEQLLALLRLADYQPPQALLHWLLVGPWRGREKLVARLGREANDPIDELLNAAHAYAASDTPSLTGFLHWFDAGEGELKREAEGSGGLVRVMTVHGSKGLQAPIVILADAADNPDYSRPGALDLPGPAGAKVPLPGLGKAERVGPLLEAETVVSREEREEHWRLLYVAMTRAEEALFVTGSLSGRETVPAPDSWYAQMEQVLAGSDWLADEIWEARLEHGSQPELPPRAVEAPELDLPVPLPPWLLQPPGQEPRPPRPLAPSSLGEDQGADPPVSPGALADAARRGTLIHRLLERLPELPPEADRRGAALAWLARSAADLEPGVREELAERALAVIAQPDWAELFTPAALAEVPVAAVVGGQVVAGTVDLLLVGPDAVRFIDFKTARRPPETIDGVPGGILRQMGAYAAALAAIYPGRTISGALLYTQTPCLIPLSPALLDAHKPGLATAE